MCSSDLFPSHDRVGEIMKDKSMQYLARFNYLMRQLERLTSYSKLLDEFEEKYMSLKDYDFSLNKLNRELQLQVNQLERELDK